MKNQCDCIILAAGLSTRMGRWKQQLPYQDGTILDASIHNALVYCERVILVAGYQALELINKYNSESRITVVTNPQYQLGMFSSIQCGVKEISSATFFITHGDMPCINSDVYYLLDEKFKHLNKKVLFPGDRIATGHPVLFSNELQEKILQANSHTKMKQLLKECDSDIGYLGLSSEMGILKDIDTPDDYHTLKLLSSG
ncbi:TPA: NTP transferase domain-containing protein [Photobacterium damselae]